jgi:esterase/lipase superfamily enzyme
MTVVYFGTNRRPNNASKPTAFGGEFSQNGLADLRFGEATVTTKKVQEIRTYPEKLSLKTPTLGSTNLFDSLRQRMKDKKKDVLLYIHGFNVDFNEALIAAGQMATKYRIGSSANKPEVVLFSWPSDGKFTHYPSDRHDAQSSGKAVARGIEKVVRFLKDLAECDSCGRKIHLLAHSMGNYVLRHALTELATQSNRLPGIIDQIILAAADEDDDALERRDKLARLHELCNRVTVYYNAGDLALAGSDITKGNPDRLGSNGPKNSRALHRKFVAVNCENHASGLTEHSYYLDNKEVRTDISMVLAGKEGKRKLDPHTNSFVLT